MTDMTPVDVGAAVKAALNEIKDGIRKSTADFDAARTALQAKLDDQAKEIKGHGTAFADTKAKVDEIARAMAGFAGDLQKHATAIERLNAELKAPGRGATATAAADDEAPIVKAAKKFYAVKHYGDAGDGAVDEFDPKVVDADKVKSYAAARRAFWEAFRTPKGYQTIEQYVDQETARALDPLRISKSISTVSHGNRFWLTSEMTDLIVQCYDEVTDLSMLFSSMWISRGAVELMVDNDVEKRARFKCELNCAPQPGPGTVQPGAITIPVHEMHDSECITHTMLEDSEIDLESYLVPRVAEAFSRARNEKFIWGSGNQEPMGLLRPGNHLEMPSSSVAGPPGQFTWQHLRVMPFLVAKRFQANGSYMFSRDALMSLFTIADGQGRPLVDGYLDIGVDGIMRLWGMPVTQVDQLQNYLDTSGANAVPSIGSKPIGFGDWESAYMIVNRTGFFALRDPAYNPCGVTWHFGMRCGGGVLCPNASVFLKIV